MNGGQILAKLYKTLKTLNFIFMIICETKQIHKLLKIYLRKQPFESVNISFNYDTWLSNKNKYAKRIKYHF